MSEATFALDTTTMQVRALDQVVNVSAIVEAQRQRQADAPLIEHFNDALTAGGMNHTELLRRVARDANRPLRAVREVFDRYCSEDLDDPGALWIETRMRVNNTRHVALKPRARA